MAPGRTVTGPFIYVPGTSENPVSTSRLLNTERFSAARPRELNNETIVDSRR